MDFSAALTAVKNGAKITRTGWNGAGQYVVHQPGYPDGIAINANTAAATGLPQGTVCRFRPYLMHCTKQGDFVPWVASISDILANDWTTVDELDEMPASRNLTIGDLAVNVVLYDDGDVIERQALRTTRKLQRSDPGHAA